MIRDRLLRNMGWMGVAELMSRVSRLAAAVILARNLGVADYGVAAIAASTAELVNVLTRNGIGARIVQATEAQLEAVCYAAYRYNRGLCFGLFVLQCALAWPAAWYYQEPRLAAMIAVLALSYLVYPYAMVQVYLAQRDNRLRLIGMASGGQVTLDNLASAVLAWQGLGIWSVVLPKLLVAPLWVLLFRRAVSWRPRASMSLDSRADSVNRCGLLRFSSTVLCSEVLKTLRGNLDKLLIGSWLGLETLGIYAFAVNAGMGLSLSLVSAFNAAVYPHLCDLRQSRVDFFRAYRRSLRLVGYASVAVLGLQFLAAPWYVPVVFGARWSHAVPLLMLLALSAIPRPLAETAGQMLRAVDQAGLDLRWNLALTLSYTAVLLWAMPYGLVGVALTTVALHWSLTPLYLTWLHRRPEHIFYTPVMQGVLP